MLLSDTLHLEREVVSFDGVAMSARLSLPLNRPIAIDTKTDPFRSLQDRGLDRLTKDGIEQVICTSALSAHI